MEGCKRLMESYVYMWMNEYNGICGNCNGNIDLSTWAEIFVIFHLSLCERGDLLDVVNFVKKKIRLFTVFRG